MSVPVPVLPDDCLVVRLPIGTPIMRVHWSDKGPIFFGPPAGIGPSNRFDAPAGEYGTLYVAEDLAGAFAETLLRKAARLVGWPAVAQRSFSMLTLQREVTLAQLHGDGLAWHGVTSDICAGDDYGPSQAISLAFYAKGLDGIAYRSRHNNDQLCYALFDLVAPTDLAIVETHDFAGMAAIADQLVRRHGAAWDKMLALPPLSKLP
jgi:hypothetical protein